MPAFNHTRGDSPLTPCPECAADMERRALAVNQATGAIVEAEVQAIEDYIRDLTSRGVELDRLRTTTSLAGEDGRAYRRTLQVDERDVYEVNVKLTETGGVSMSARELVEIDDIAPHQQCSDCGAEVLGYHACEGVPGGFGDE